MLLYIFISTLFIFGYSSEIDFSTQINSGNDFNCLTEIFYGKFTNEELTHLIKRRKNVRELIEKNISRKELETLYVPTVFHNLYKIVDGIAENSYCDFGFDELVNNQDICNERMLRSLEVLNAQYLPSGVQFVLHPDYPEMLHESDPSYNGFYGNASGGNSTTPTPNDIKKHYNVPNALNIYTHECLPGSDTPCDDDKFGFSTYPWSLDINEPGIFIKNQSLPGSGDIYNGAKTSQVGILAHEISHSFSLQHINGTWFLKNTNTPRGLVSGDDCAFHGDLICDTPASPGFILINSDLKSYYTNHSTHECIYHGYGGNYNPDSGILKIGGYSKSYDLGSYPSYNYCEEWGFVDPFQLNNCELFTNYDNQGNFFGTYNLIEECINEDQSEYASECHIDQYLYLPIGQNFMQAGTNTLYYCSPRPIGHVDYDDSYYGFTTEQFSNIRTSLALDYTACNIEGACNTGFSIRKEIKPEYLLLSGESSCLYPCNKQESEIFYEEFYGGCLITDSLYQSDYLQYDCFGNLLSLNQNIIPNFYGITQIYPNPFNPTTTIRYSLFHNTNIQISIYNITGRLIATLINEFQIAGNNSITWDASNYSSGIYFIQMASENIFEYRKVVLIK